MKTLMEQRSLAKINVGDIVALCDLNRNSFYYHFKDKYDLVNWIFYTDALAEFSREELVQTPTWTVVEWLCDFFYRNKHFYINALSVSGQNSFEEYFLELLRTLFLTRTPDLFQDDEYLDFYTNFFVDAFSAAILRWLKEGAKIPPAQLTQLFQKAVTGAAIELTKDLEQE